MVVAERILPIVLSYCEKTIFLRRMLYPTILTNECNQASSKYTKNRSFVVCTEERNYNHGTRTSVQRVLCSMIIIYYFILSAVEEAILNANPLRCVLTRIVLLV